MECKKIDPSIFLNYHNTFNEIHDFSALALLELSTYYDNNFKAERKNFLSNELEQLPAGDPTTQKNDGGAYEEGRAAWITRLNYAYKQKYMAEFVMRIDGSSKFATGKRWGYFPGILVGWRLSEEDFMKKYSKS